ncbi:MAG: TrmH family RNA methyltransferase [Planctomycetaceae bacterium]
MSDTPTISSLQNPAVRYVVRLRDNRYRQREGVAVVDGVREIGRAIEAGLELKSLFVSEHQATLTKLASSSAHKLIRVSDNVLNKIAFGQHHRDAVAVFEAPTTSLEQLKLGATPLVVVLDAIEKPGNVGAIFRSADAIGADAVVICEGACDRFNPSVIRSSLGTVFSLPSAQANRKETIAWLAAQGLKIVTARVDAATAYWDVDYRESVAIVIGSEAHGLGPQWQLPATIGEQNSIAVRIPMAGAADSLNASVSAALLMFEARRQRG